jgi:hypothetical protein
MDRRAKRAIILAAAVALLLASGECLAAGKAKKKSRDGACAGSSAPAAVLSAEKEADYRALDLDGDGSVSLAEAAGNEKVVRGFDRADRNRDGQLSRAEFARLGQKSKPRHGPRGLARAGTQPASRP